MRAHIAIARRELLERRVVWLAAGIAGLLPFAAPWLPQIRSYGDDARDAAAFFLSAGFSAVLAVVLGSTLVTRELIDRRLGFYFVRPISEGAIWSGKMLAGFLVTVSSGILILLPSTIVGGGLFSWKLNPAETLLVTSICLSGVLLLLTLGHAVSVMFRSRSGLLVLDVLGLVAVITLVLTGRRLLVLADARPAILQGAILLTAGVLAALWAAGLRQVAHGRTELGRGHAALSRTLWSVLLPLAFSLWAASLWVVRTPPQNLRAIVEVSPAATGRWIALAGLGRGGALPTFLLDPTSGKWIGTGPVVSQQLKTVFSADGRRVAWLRYQGAPRNSPVEVEFADLVEDSPVIRRSSITVYATDSLMLSPTGSRLAAFDERTIRVFDLESGKTLTVLRLSPSSTRRLFRLDDEVLRTYGGDFQSPGLELRELVLKSKTARITGHITGKVLPLGLSPIGDRLAVWDLGDSCIGIHDSRSGNRIARIPYTDSPWLRPEVLFLSDGRVATVHSRGMQVAVFSSGGTLERKVAFPGEPTLLVVGGEPRPGWLTVGLPVIEFPGPWNAKSPLFLVELSTGRSREVARGLLPVTPPSRRDNSGFYPSPGAEATKLYYGPNGSLVRFDPLTGVRRVILAGRT